MSYSGGLTRRERILFGIFKWLIRLCMIVATIEVLVIKGWRDGWMIAALIVAAALYFEIKMRLPRSRGKQPTP